jgi:ribosomal protein S18 acetylase RimI-like enzyme
MIMTAREADGSQIQDITARAGVFNQEEVDCVSELWQEYLTLGSEQCGYNFIVDREGDQVLGFACYGPRDLTDGVYDLYWIAVDPNARRKRVGHRLLTASEEAVRESGGRILIAETSGTPHYESTRKFYSWVNVCSLIPKLLEFLQIQSSDLSIIHDHNIFFV